MLQNPSVNPVLRRAIKLALTGSSLAAIGVAHGQTQLADAAAATTPEAAPAEVVVTGTRIVVPNQTSISPITQVTSNDIQQTGVTRVEDLLDQLPQVFASQNSTAANGASGTAEINLRGLGTNRTLILVNGQRLGPGDALTGSAADINIIPIALVDSIDILTGGASATYGADAVAGVVNFHLNDHFEGLEVVANGGIYENDNSSIAGLLNTSLAGVASYPSTPSSIWDGAQTQITVIAGTNSEDNKGNATVYFSYSQALAALEGNYSYAACTLGSGFLAGNSSTGGKYYCGGSATGFPTNIFDPATGGTWAGVGPNGTIVTAGGGNVPPYLYNYGALNYFSRPDQRYMAGAFLHYDVSDHVTVYSQTMFMDDFTQAQIAGSGLFGNIPASEVNCANPFLDNVGNTPSQLAQALGCTSTAGFGAAGTYLYRRDVEGGGRVQAIEHMDIHQVIGLRGKINDAWSYDASYNYWLDNLNSDAENYFSDNKVANALDVVQTATGPQCVSGPPCVPYNPFDTTTAGVTQAALNYLYTPGITVARVFQHDAQLNFNGDLSKYVQLPTAGSGLQVAFGGEYREEHAQTLPDEETQIGDLGGVGGTEPPVAGTLAVKEGYVETQMPIVEDHPFAKAIDLNAGYRYSSYTLGFDTNTYKIGLDWAPSSDVRLRGSFTRAVRAPNITELFSADAVELDSTYTSDPCGPNPVYSKTQCERTGVTEGEYGSSGLRNPAGQYNGLLGGNIDLRPETALTKSFGVVFTPSFLPNFRAGIDYYDIDIEDEIQSAGAAYILQECAVDDLDCNLIHRNPANGSLWQQNGYVTDTLVNIGSLEEEGVDFDLGYRVNLGAYGRLNAHFDGTYIDKYEVTLALSSFDCAGYEGSVCASAGAQNPIPNWRSRFDTTWQTPWSGLDVTLTWRFIGATTLESLSGVPALGGGPGITVADGGISNTDDHIPAFDYFDLTTSIVLDQYLTMRLGCNNIFDKMPPLIGATNIAAPPTGNGNTYPGMYDSLGRYIFAELKATF